MPAFRSTGRFFTAAAVLILVILAHAHGQEKPNPIAAQVKASVKDPTKPFTLVVTLKTKEGAGEKLEAAFAKAVKPTRQEKGCLAYELSRDAKTPTQYVIYERWQSLAALEAHLKAAHITPLLMELGELLAGPPEAHVLLPVGD